MRRRSIEGGKSHWSKFFKQISTSMEDMKQSKMEVDEDADMDVVETKDMVVVVAKAKEEEDNIIMRKEVKIFKQIEVVEEGITPWKTNV